MNEQEPIGFIGLGNMGGRMTRRLVAAGRRVIGYDVTADRAASVGALQAASVAEVVETASLVMLSLPDSSAVEAVIEGPGGVISRAREGQTVIDLSTSAPASTTRLAKRLAEHGVDYLDAGISGGAAAADRGALTLMVGGNRSAVDAARPTLEAFSAKLFYMGPSGAGHTTKLINNMLNAVTLAATAEAMVAGKKAGLDLHLLLEVINSSSGVNFASQNRFPHIVNGDYLEGGLTSKLMTKDIVLYIDRARELGVASLNAAGPLACFGLATSLGYGDQISNRVVDAIGDVSGRVRLNGAAEHQI